MAREGKQLAGSVAETPELRPGLQLYLEAFFDLDSDRTHNEGLSPIPWRSIKEYAETFGFDEEQTADLFYFVRELDGEHLKRLAAKMKEKAKHGPNVKRPSRPNGKNRR